MAHRDTLLTIGAEQHHKPELDGIRGIAILAVLASHSMLLQVFGPTPFWDFLRHALIPGWAGVDLFFALSGFLITGILLRTKASPNYFQSFYWRRILRIFPIYYMTLIFLLGVGHFSHFFHATLPSSPAYRASYFFFMQNMPVFARGYLPSIPLLGPYWSLAVEEQFYLLWPFVILKASEKSVMRFCVAGLIVAPILRIALVHFVFRTNFELVELPTSRMDGLLGGAFCSLYMHTHRKLVPLRWIVAATTCGALTIACIALKTSGRELIETGKYMNTFGVSGFALLSSALLALSQYHFRWLQRPLCFAWLRALGRYSYGMYIYHAFVYVGLRYALIRIMHGIKPLSSVAALMFVAFCMLATVGMAKASFDLFEIRFLALKRYFRPLRPDAGTSGAAMRVEDQHISA